MWILSFLIVDLVITDFGKTAGVVRLVVVNTGESSLNNAFVIIAGMTHIFSRVLPIIMIALTKLIQFFKNFYQVIVIFLFHFQFKLAIILIKKLSKQFLFFAPTVSSGLHIFFRLFFNAFY